MEAGGLLDYPPLAKRGPAPLFTRPTETVKQVLLNLRTKQNLQRSIQLASGILVLCVVLVCVLTLVTNPHARSSSSSRQRARQPAVLTESLRAVSSFDTTLSDVFISVKTSHKFHSSRLGVILKTWFQLAPYNTFFFTDKKDPEVSGTVGGNHLVVTDCPPDHSRQALCCKMQAEFDFYLTTTKKWFCHFDDDQYVNVPGLVKKLGAFPRDREWYLGKPSIEKPLEILDRDHDWDRDTPRQQKKIKFWFATGGAGFCLSRPLALKMAGLAADGKFSATGEKMRLPDDVTMGYIVEQLAEVAMTRLEEFHSHLEPLRLVTNLQKQISFSYSTYSSSSSGGEERNIVDVEGGGGGFSVLEDPTRFLSIHCHLFPYTQWCPSSSR